jgi:DNA-binding MarR family transcriptional regulator
MAEEQIKLTDPRSLRGYAHPLRMSLLGLLRSEGPLTATQAAAALGENVPNCSFHLRQMAKYGMVERAPGADARERPWRATAHSTSWDDASPDPATRAAAAELTTVLLGQYGRQAKAFLATRAGEPAEWRAVTGFGDTILHVTAEELSELAAEMSRLLARYDARRDDRAARPPGARAVQVIQMLLPFTPVTEPFTPATEHD